MYIKQISDSDGENIPEEMEMVDSSSRENRIIGKVLLCFSIYTNSKAIFNTKAEGEMDTLHGLRFLSMIWIVMAHSVLYTMDYFGK